MPRELDGTLSDDPYSIVTSFESLVYFDGLDQARPWDVVEVIHALKEVNAPQCTQVINEFLDFIEAKCSPEGHYESSLVDHMLIKYSSTDLPRFEKMYQEASEVENPQEQFKAAAAKQRE